jgi:hypothetical protein
MSDAHEPSGPPASERVHPLSRALALLEHPRFPAALTWGLGALAVGTALLDLVHHRHALFTWEGLIGFHGWFGFAAFSFVVLMLRRLLSRPESYYGEGDEDA